MGNWYENDFTLVLTDFCPGFRVGPVFRRPDSALGGVILNHLNLSQHHFLTLYTSHVCVNYNLQKRCYGRLHCRTCLLGDQASHLTFLHSLYRRPSASTKPNTA